jgi:dihydrofolate reductase
MGKVFVDITTSLDGFIAGPNDSPDLGLGEGGERLHEWVYGLATWREPHGLAGGTRGQDAEILDEAFRDTGAVVLGKRMFDNAKGWGDNPPFHVPVFVLTHEARETITKEGGTTFTFVTDGIESTLAQARDAAGDKNISIAGGANTIEQYLHAGLIDEMQIHLVPLMLGGGIRLFDQVDPELIQLEGTRVVESPGVTHLKYRVVK